jgi:hypothetical protein
MPSESDHSDVRMHYNFPTFTGRPGKDNLAAFERQLPQVFRMLARKEDRDQVDILCGTLVPYDSPAYEIIDSALPDVEKRTRDQVLDVLRRRYDSAEVQDLRKQVARQQLSARRFRDPSNPDQAYESVADFIDDIQRLGRAVGLLDERLGATGEEQLVEQLLNSSHLFSGNEALRGWLSSRGPKTIADFYTHMTSYFTHHQRMDAGRPRRRPPFTDDLAPAQAPAPNAAPAPPTSHEYDRRAEHQAHRDGRAPRPIVPPVPEGWAATDGKPRQAAVRGRPISSYLLEAPDDGDEGEDVKFEDGSQDLEDDVAFIAPGATKFSRPPTPGSVPARPGGSTRFAAAPAPRVQHPCSFRYKDTGKICSGEDHTLDDHLRQVTWAARLGYDMTYDPSGPNARGSSSGKA